MSRTIEDVLRSTSEVLFPAKLGARSVTLDSVGVGDDTSVHVLVWRGDTEGALLLIEYGADVNAPGDMGEIPLHVAVRQGDLRLIRALLAAGARRDVPSELGPTPQALADAGASTWTQDPGAGGLAASGRGRMPDPPGAAYAPDRGGRTLAVERPAALPFDLQARPADGTDPA